MTRSLPNEIIIPPEESPKKKIMGRFNRETSLTTHFVLHLYLIDGHWMESHGESADTSNDTIETLLMGPSNWQSIEQVRGRWEAPSQESNSKVMCRTMCVDVGGD